MLEVVIYRCYVSVPLVWHQNSRYSHRNCSCRNHSQRCLCRPQCDYNSTNGGRDHPCCDHVHPRCGRQRCDCPPCGRGYPSAPTLAMSLPLPDKPPAGPRASSKTNVRHPCDRPVVVVDAGCTRSLPLMLPPCSNEVPQTLPISFRYISLVLSHMHSHADSRLSTTRVQRNSRTMAVD